MRASRRTATGFIYPSRKTFLLALLVAELVAAIFILPRLQSGSPTRNAKPAPPSVKAETVQRHVNRAAGYSFGYPRGWRETDQGEISQIASPDRHAVVNFAPIPSGGDAFSSSSQLANVLSRSYDRFRLLDRTATYVNGSSAIAVEGKAITSRRVPIRLYAVAVTAGGGRYGAIGFWSPAAHKTQVERVRQIVQSFRAAA